jgi:O-antigen/teichoic acid export membrane protein
MSLFSFIKKLQKREKSLLAEAIIETEVVSMPNSFSKLAKKRLFSLLNNKQIFLSGGALVIATFTANVLNYIFNAYLGRVLTFNQFALIGLIGGFYSFSTIFFGAYSTTVNYRSGFLIGKYGEGAGYNFWKHTRKLALYPSVIFAVLWLLSLPLLMNFFHTTNIFLFLLFGLVILIGFTSNVNQGFLFSKMMFGSLAIISLTDPIIRLAVTFSLVYFGFNDWTFSAIPFAVLGVFLAGFLLITKQVKNTITNAPSEVYAFPKKFFVISLLAAFSSAAYFTFDIILAKHFLSPAHAGEYALVSLVGKMIFFLGNLTSPFVIPLISRHEGAQKNSLHTLYILLGFTTLFVLVGFLLFGVFGYFTVPILYGEKAQVIVPYLVYYTFGMACYTVSNVIVSYYLARKNYLFTIVSALLILVQIGLILLFHDTVKSIVTVMTLVMLLNLVIAVTLHFGLKQIMVAEKYTQNVYTSIRAKYNGGINK